MSVAATTWAWARPSGPGGVRGNDRLVLLAIADAADSKGQNAWPAIETIAAMAGLSERTVQRSIRSLEQLGILTIERNAGGDHRVRVDRRPNRYGLMMASDHGVTDQHPVELGEPVDSQDHGVTDRAVRGDKSGHRGVTQLCHPNKDLNRSEPIASTGVDAGEISLRSAVLEACEVDPERITRTAEGVITKAVSDLAAVGASPGDVPAAARNFRDRFPVATLTPAGLAKHWPQLAPTRAREAMTTTAATRFGRSLALTESDRQAAIDEIEDEYGDGDDRVEALAAYDARHPHLEDAPC